MLTPLDMPSPAGWPVLAESDGMRLLENPLALARVFVPRRVRAEPDPAGRLAILASIRDFAEQGVVEDAGEAGDWTDNGTASVRIAAYGAQRLDLDVDAAADTVLGDVDPGLARVEGHDPRPPARDRRLQPCVRRDPGASGPIPRHTEVRAGLRAHRDRHLGDVASHRSRVALAVGTEPAGSEAGMTAWAS